MTAHELARELEKLAGSATDTATEQTKGRKRIREQPRPVQVLMQQAAAALRGEPPMTLAEVRQRKEEVLQQYNELVELEECARAQRTHQARLPVDCHLTRGWHGRKGADGRCVDCGKQLPPGPNDSPVPPGGQFA